MAQVETSVARATSEWQALIAIVPALLWFLLAVATALALRREIIELLRNLVWRVKAGAPFKLSVFELGAVKILPQAAKPLAMTHWKVDENKVFHDSRQCFRDVNLFLVHRISPSAEAGQLYDVLIYIVPGQRHGSLLNVVAVDYYFGRYWEQHVFEARDRATAFSISTAAFAPFTCTARVRYNDGRDALVHRYIDFEMGGLGSTAGA